MTVEASSSNSKHARASTTWRAALLLAVAAGSSACANEPLNGGQPRFAAPMMLLNTPAAAAEAPQAGPQIGPQGIAHKSLAAKVLASRALEAVTGLKPDPARLSEHD